MDMHDFPIDAEDAKQIRLGENYKIVKVCIHPKGMAKSDFSNSEMIYDYTVKPSFSGSVPVLKSDENSDQLLLKFNISDDIGPAFIMIATGMWMPGSVCASTEFDNRVERATAYWEDMKKEACFLLEEKSAPNNIATYLTFFNHVMKKESLDVLGIEYTALYDFFSSPYQAASELLEWTTVNTSKNFAMSLFRQAFVEGRKMSEKQIKAMNSMGHSKESIDSASTDNSKHIEELFSDMDLVSDGARRSFFLSIKAWYKSKKFLTDKQILTLEKIHYEHRRIHKNKNITRAPYPYLFYKKVIPETETASHVHDDPEELPF
jgi:hypothetical protein